MPPAPLRARGRRPSVGLAAVVALLATLGVGAAGVRSRPSAVRAAPVARVGATSPSTSPTTTTTTPSTTTTAPPPPPPRSVEVAPGTAFAAAGPVALSLPSTSVERVGLHQSNHEGAVGLAAAPPETMPVAVPVATLESRDRLTDATTAADVVVPPDTPIVAPVTGRVLRAGSYTLYCRYRDEYVVIEPDAHPGWEVKLLHLVDEQVARGQRITAGETVVAARAHALPFASQVDALDATGAPWPHVHVEVVDPSIRNVPSPGGGC